MIKERIARGRTLSAKYPGESFAVYRALDRDELTAEEAADILWWRHWHADRHWRWFGYAVDVMWWLGLGLGYIAFGYRLFE